MINYRYDRTIYLAGYLRKFADELMEKGSYVYGATILREAAKNLKYLANKEKDMEVTPYCGHNE